MHAYEVAEDDEADEAEASDEEVPAEEALVAATLDGDTSSDEPSFDGDADMRADVEENDLHSLPRDSLCAATRVPVRFADDTGAAKLTCGKWRAQSASIHCGSFGPINWHHVACGNCLHAFDRTITTNERWLSNLSDSVQTGNHILNQTCTRTCAARHNPNR